MSFNTTTDKLLAKLATPSSGKPIGALSAWVVTLEVLRQGGVIDYTISPTTPGDTSKPWLEPVAPSLNIFNGSAWVSATIATAFPVLAGKEIPPLGSVGSYGFFRRADTTMITNPGDIVAGSSLNWSGASHSSGYYNDSGISPSGSWKALGYTNHYLNATLYIRVS